MLHFWGGRRVTGSRWIGRSVRHWALVWYIFLKKAYTTCESCQGKFYSEGWEIFSIHFHWMKCEPELEPSTLIGQTIRWRNIIVGNSAGILLLFLSNQFQTRLQLRVQLKYKRRLFFLRANVKRKRRSRSFRIPFSSELCFHHPIPDAMTIDVWNYSDSCWLAVGKIVNRSIFEWIIKIVIERMAIDFFPLVGRVKRLGLGTLENVLTFFRRALELIEEMETQSQVMGIQNWMFAFAKDNLY